MPSHHIPTEQLHDILAEECICLEYLDLVSAHGFYLYLEECTVIGISNAIVHNQKLSRTVLAEEIGHHFTVTSNKQPVQYLTYHDRLSLDKSESAALRWAADFLIPTAALLEVVSDHTCLNLEELSDHFGVMDYLLNQKLYTMASKSMVYPLSNGRQLVLSALPYIIHANM